MKIVADGMIHHVTKAFMEFKIFLAAVMAIMALNDGAAIQTIIFVAVVLFHDLISYQICFVACFNAEVCLYRNTKGKITAITSA